MTAIYVTVWLLVVNPQVNFVTNIATKEDCEILASSFGRYAKCIPYRSVVGVGQP